MTTHKTLQYIPTIPEQRIVNVREAAEESIKWMRFRLAAALAVGGGK